MKAYSVPHTQYLALRKNYLIYSTEGELLYTVTPAFQMRPHDKKERRSALNLVPLATAEPTSSQGANGRGG